MTVLKNPAKTASPAWRNQRVAVVGFGREGRAMVEYLLGKGAELTVCDEKDSAALGTSFEKLRGKKIIWHLGPSYLQGLDQFDVIVRSPGVPLSLPQIKRAEQKGVVIWSLTKEFFAHCPAPIIGITGTKGKGTTAALITEMLKAGKHRVFLVGNIGVPAIEVLSSLKKTDWVVYEMSSFQLQDLAVSPPVAVMLGLTIDHQDYHKNPQEYFLAKSSIVKFQKKSDAAIFNIDYPETLALKDLAGGQVYTTSRRIQVKRGAFVENGLVYRRVGNKTEMVIKASEIGLRGEHNLENVTAAVVAASLTGVGIPAIKKVLAAFQGLPHRLEPIGSAGGVEYWNNSYAATPEAAIASIRAFHEPIVILLGGSDKGHTFEKLGEAVVESSVKAIVGIGLTAPKMYAAIKAAAIKTQKKPPAYVEGGKTMPEMVRTARKFAKAGDIILLSPGAASFDRFRNYTERGEQFQAEVKKLQKKSTRA